MPTIFKWIKREVAKERKNRNELHDFFRPSFSKFSFSARYTYIVVDAMHSICLREIQSSFQLSCEHKASCKNGTCMVTV